MNRLTLPLPARGSALPAALSHWFASHDVLRFLRFACVGAANTGIHAGVLVLLVEVLLWWPPPANACAFFCANLFGFFGHSLFTFRRAPSLGRYPRFLAASLTGTLFSYGISLLGTSLGWHYLVAFAIQLVVMPVINYLLIRNLAFRQ